MPVRVVLIETTHAGNIGAVARAMGNMGLHHLELVRPVEFLNDEAFARSAGNESILKSANVRENLDDAIGDCEVVIGTSARSRTIQWPSLTPEQAMGEALKASKNGQNVALLFGPERTGLENHHIDRCTVVVRIPVDDQSPSINLAGAVLIMLYELRKAMLPEEGDSEVPVSANAPSPATGAEMTGLFEHLEEVLRYTGFITDGPRESLLRKIKRIFVRSGMSDEEVNIMRGIFTSILTQRPKSGSKSKSTSGRNS